MSTWPGKYVIGLTGNIATGKSVVRKMLEHMGAYGIDADALGHRAIAQGAPGYQPVVDTFGRWILAADGQIDRSRLSKVVFTDADALERLEAIVHPLVREAVDVLVRRAQQKVIVLEAIKLLESPLSERCDSIWVTSAPIETQVARLLQKRGMTETAARQRIAAQPPQEQKIAAADIVIQNQGSFDDTWRQVASAWQTIFPAADTTPVQKPAAKGQMVVQRGRPKQAAEIAALITRLSRGQHKLTRADVMAAFGEKAYLLLKIDERLVGLVGWQVENLVARTDDLYLEENIPFSEGIRAVMHEVELASRELQCEIALVFLSAEQAKQVSAKQVSANQVSIWQSLGYEARSIQSLGVRAWQEAAIESMPPGSVMLFKQLRKDRVLRPV